MKNSLKNPILFALCISSASALANENPESPITLGKAQGLAQALNQILPQEGPQPYNTILKAAAFTGVVEGKKLLVSCESTISYSRASNEPIIKFQGCEAQLTESVDAGIPEWTLLDLLKEAALK